MGEQLLKFAHFPHIARLLSAETVPAHARLSVLDVGCGPGTLVNYYPVPLPYDVYGLDLWPHQLRQAAAKRLYAGLLQANLVDGIPFRNESFDIIVCGEILLYLPNPRQILAECCRLLRPGGMLLVYNPISRFPKIIGKLKKWSRMVYQEKSTIAMDCQRDWKISTRPCRVTYYKPGGLIEDVNATGLRVENITAFRLLLNRIRALNKLEDYRWYRRASELIARRYPHLATDILIEARKDTSTQAGASVHESGIVSKISGVSEPLNLRRPNT